MTKYVIRRLLLFIPSLAVVTLIAFWLMVKTPGNPVDRLIHAGPENVSVTTGTNQNRIREEWIEKLGLNLPLFYVSVSSLSDADSSGNTASASWKNWIPVIRFHGDNRYHRWVFGDGNWLTGEGAQWSKGVIRGDFGLSYQTRQPVTVVIAERIGWSLLLSVGSVLLALLISVPIAAAAARKPGSWLDHTSATVLTLLFSIPSFWLATMLLITFANPDVLAWFPASGVKPVTGYAENTGFFGKLISSLPYLILPFVCYTYSSVAFLSRTLRASLGESLQQDYSRTARAKGLSEEAVVYRHAFRNSLLPLITVAAHVFPAAIGGSVILETIFSIPGMGSETVNAIQMQNYPMVVAVFTITSFLTMTGILIADVLYVAADPRIRFDRH